MELSTIIEIVRAVATAVTMVVPFLAKSGVGKSLWRQISFPIWPPAHAQSRVL